MSRTGWLCTLGACVFWLSAPARGGDPPAGNAALLALQEAMQKAIQDVEPSVACILVSRSDEYQRFGQGPSADDPGKLGAFDPDAVERHPLLARLSDEERKARKRKLD